MRLLVQVPVFLLLLYYAGSNLSYVVLAFVSLRANAKHKFRRSTVKLESLKRSPFLPFVSIIVPAWNEELTIVESVRALLDLDYPELEVIVVNDGSSDATLARLQGVYQLREARLLYVPEIATREVHGIFLSACESRLVVIDKDSGG